MSKITHIEKNALLKLFNRGGYVLNFSTNDFDVFTLESIGVALCQKYMESKGKSLTAYVTTASDTDVLKLFSDLLTHYELHYQNEIDGDSEYGSLYKKCCAIIDRIKGVVIPLSKSAKELEQKFSSDYISAQIGIMLQETEKNPTEAIGKAKEFIESCCKTILEERFISVDEKWDVRQLVGQTTTLLKLTPANIPENSAGAQTIKSLLGNLRAIASNMAALRNPYGSGHGKSATYKGLESRHANLAVGSAITLVQFLWNTHEHQLKK